MRSQTAFWAVALTAVLVAGCGAASSTASAVSTPAPTFSSGSPMPATPPLATTAMGSTQTIAPTIGPAPTPAWTCSAPVTVDELAWASVGPLDKLLGCFGKRDIEVTGYLAPSWGVGGLGNGVAPAWLGEWAGLEQVLWRQPHPVDSCGDNDCMWIYLHAPDTAALPLSPDRWVSLTGHFDDPGALSCRAAGSGPDAVTSDVQAVITCREHFVVTEIRTVAPPAS